MHLNKVSDVVLLTLFQSLVCVTSVFLSASSIICSMVLSYNPVFDPALVSIWIVFPSVDLLLVNGFVFRL